MDACEPRCVMHSLCVCILYRLLNAYLAGRAATCVHSSHACICVPSWTHALSHWMDTCTVTLDGHMHCRMKEMDCYLTLVPTRTQTPRSHGPTIDHTFHSLPLRKFRIDRSSFMGTTPVKELRSIRSPRMSRDRFGLCLLPIWLRNMDTHTCEHVERSRWVLAAEL